MTGNQNYNEARFREIIKNPSIIYGIFMYPNHKFTKEEYIEELWDVVNDYYGDSLERDKDENLFLYIDKEYIGNVYVGREQTNDMQEFYARVSFLDILSEKTDRFGDRFPDENRVRKFVDENFDKSFFDE